MDPIKYRTDLVVTGYTWLNNIVGNNILLTCIYVLLISIGSINHLYQPAAVLELNL